MSDSGKNIPAPHSGAPAVTDMKGWLAKWTNYLKGYQKRWFVLHDGLLSYYRNQAEMSHTCRGTISLDSAVIHTEDSCNFVISNGGAQTFHLKAGNEVERQKWVTALELAKSHSIRRQEAEEDEERGLGLDQVSPKAAQDEQERLLRTLAAKRDDLRTCNDLVAKHSYALMRCLGDLEQTESSDGDVAARKIMKQVNERATLFRITSTNIVKTSVEFVEVAQSLYHQWSRLLEHEHSQRLKLEEQLEQLARQHSHLERAAKEAASSGGWNNYTTGSEGDEEEFFDAAEENDNGPHDFVLSLPNPPLQQVIPGHAVRHSKAPRHSGSTTSEGNELSGGSSDDESDESPQFAEASVVRRKRSSTEPQTAEQGGIIMDHTAGEIISTSVHRRSRVPEKPNCSISLWSIMKNCIGKELTKIPMPVHFNEPLSTLQRLAEDYEYSALLDKAARCSDPHQQLVYIACFAISSYSTTANRTGKPFNPLLGRFLCF
ncbi:oxysterol-binding protein 1-like [Varroa destructor]|uniref:PH domain-containing protein n=1 Tax=Varroa destructor TaxID=109461 RepID=A0A7M7KNQ2_VARDE|nr:oxysterol-binding protein 1-like [Varroa destructor]